MSEIENNPEEESVFVRLAGSEAEIEAAQRLRYEVFYEEYGAKPSAEMEKHRLDVDEYDDFADHLVVIDKSSGVEKIVGTYRLLERKGADKIGQFYSAGEYDLAPLLKSNHSLLELGRSCVLNDFRTRPVLQLLWQGLADYVSDHEIDILFGCASLPSTDIKSISKPLSYLHHYHLAPEIIRPRAIKGRYINMNIVPEDDLDVRRVFAELPPLIKGYLRTGACIGDGAVVDEQFNTTDVFVVMPTHLVADRYKKHYERKINKPIGNADNIEHFSDFVKKNEA